MAETCILVPVSTSFSASDCQYVARCFLVIYDKSAHLQHTFVATIVIVHLFFIPPVLAEYIFSYILQQHVYICDFGLDIRLNKRVIHTTVWDYQREMYITFQTCPRWIKKKMHFKDSKLASEIIQCFLVSNLASEISQWCLLASNLASEIINL